MKNKALGKFIDTNVIKAKFVRLSFPVKSLMLMKFGKEILEKIGLSIGYFFPTAKIKDKLST